jgi:glycopeptide antibiotics resistance protein
MNGDNKVMRVLLWAALVFCLLVLTKYILFKKSPVYYKHYFAHEYKNYRVNDGWAHANLHPFSTIRLFSSNRVSTEYSYKNIGGNIVGFIPLGILLPLLFPFFKNILKVTGAVFLLSLLFETTQLFAGIGVFDVDDLILNTFGGIIGYCIYAMTRWMLSRLGPD